MATSLTGFQGIRPPQSGRVAGYNVNSVAQYSPEQMQLFEQLLGQVGPESYLSRLAGGDQSSFEQMEAPALQQFAGLQGNIASRFSGMGSGARKSSGFQNTMNQATQDFASQLQSRRGDLQRQALMDLSNMSQQLLSNRPYQQFMSPPKKSFWEKLLGGAAPLLGAAGGFYFGGMPGAQLGGQLGSSFTEGLYS